jgi:hypothetical protein
MLGFREVCPALAIKKKREKGKDLNPHLENPPLSKNALRQIAHL